MSASRPPHKHDFLPSREADLLNWSGNFIGRINDAPGPQRLGLTAAQAAAYASLHEAFVQAYARSQNPSERTPSQIMAKHEARKALKANARLLARIIRAHPEVTNQQRVELRLTLPDEHLTPVNVLDQKPVLVVNATSGRKIRVGIRSSATATRQARPAGSIGALVLTYVAPRQSAEETTPPESMSKWSFSSLATRSEFVVNVPSDAPAGSKVWIVACWVNTRGECGPFGNAASTHIGDGLAAMPQSLRLAA